MSKENKNSRQYENPIDSFVVGVRPRAPTLFMADEDVRHAQSFTGIILLETEFRLSLCYQTEVGNKKINKKKPGLIRRLPDSILVHFRKIPILFQ